ncbi:MAG: glucokinase [Parvularculaceae bacterium]
MTQCGSILVGDIGGTNARFAIATPEKAGVRLDHKQVFRAEDFEELPDAIRAYLESWSGGRPARACLAVAGPVDKARIEFTNSNWSFAPDALKAALSLETLRVINDFQAMARGAIEAPEDELLTLNPGAAVADAPSAVLGPGTGLGLGLAVPTNGGVRIISTEGGHAAFAPQDEKEIEVLRFIRREHAYVSYERVLSGRGLVNLHRALCALAGETRMTLQPSEITAAALDGSLPIARKATEMFCAILGVYAGNVALITGARGGVYIAGGIAPKIEDILLASKFLERFTNRDLMRAYMEAIPVKLLTSSEAALRGAALCIEAEASR